MQRKSATDFDQRLHDLFDDYTHGRIARRDFIRRAAAFTAVGVSVESLLLALAPNYALAQQVAEDDPRIKTETIEYPSPQGGGTIRGITARPADRKGKLPAVLVVHENRGLNPHIQDVARRLAVAGFLALAPDALTPLGGYPGNDDEGRQLQAKRDGITIPPRATTPSPQNYRGNAHSTSSSNISSSGLCQLPTHEDHGGAMGLGGGCLL
jgi:carboxymethylenebutenolidase